MWFIIRHGETLGNSLGIQQGQNDTLLTLKGIIQAQSIGYKLIEQEENFNEYKFITSPLSRSRHTLQIIIEVLGLSAKAKPIIEPLLINRNKTILQGVPKKDIKNLYPEEYAKREKDPWNYATPNGGESKYECCKRLQTFIDKYKHEENLIIVAHRGINNLLRNLLAGLTLEEIKNLQTKPDRSQNYFYSWDQKEIKRI